MKKRGLILVAAFVAIVFSTVNAQAAFFGKKEKKAQKTEQSRPAAPAAVAATAAPAQQAEYSGYSAPAYEAPSAPAAVEPQAPAPANAPYGFDMDRYKGKLSGEDIRDKISRFNRQLSEERDQMAYVMHQEGASAQDVQRKSDEFDANRGVRLEEFYKELYRS